jgi:hypothetical protein
MLFPERNCGIEIVTFFVVPPGVVVLHTAVMTGGEGRVITELLVPETPVL